MAASHAKTAVDAVAAMPQGIANMSSELFSASTLAEGVPQVFVTPLLLGLEIPWCLIFPFTEFLKSV